jgi:benzoyl-CoA reductase/2-hydroxyglutaryl-CoA dehydratase subunit BcrC/BadD/HgdB
MDKKPFTKLEEILNDVLKPAAATLSRNPAPSIDGPMTLKTVELISRNIEEAVDAARNRRKKFVWHEFCLTPELFLAFDLYPFLGEIHTSIYARSRQDAIAEFIDAAENAGVPPEVCSMDKALIGAIMVDEIPQPDLIVTTSAPCDSSRIGYQVIEKLLDAPMHRLDAPFTNDADAFKYYAKQMRDFIPVLEELSGRKFDIDRLREIVEESNRALEYLLEWDLLRRLKPSPAPPSTLLNVYAAVNNSFGKPRCTEYCKALYEFTRERAESGATTGEKIRVVWQHVPPQFGDNIYGWMADEFGAVVVDDTRCGYLRQWPIDTSSLDTMLQGLARHGLNMTMGKNRLAAKLYMTDFLKARQDYSADCLIVSAHAGCKHCWPLIGIGRDFARSQNIPLLVFDDDFLDSRTVSLGTVKNKIEQFFRTMEL